MKERCIVSCHVTGQQISKAGPVVFPDAVKHHGPRRHVYTHGKRLGGKKHLEEEDEGCRMTVLNKKHMLTGNFFLHM